jgi:cold shock CspA family protein
MLNAGGSGSIFAYYDDAQESSFSDLKRDERVVVKCAVEVEYSIKLNHCVLVENKGIISPNDTPDVTFTADEYWNTVEGPNVSVDAKMKKQNDLAGKIIKITGKVKDLAGSKNYLMAGNDREISCFPDVENNGMFSSLTEGQTVSFLAVGGSSLSHCVVAR